MNGKLTQWFPIISIVFGTIFFFLLSVSQDRIIADQQAILAAQQDLQRGLDAAKADRLEALRVLHDLALDRCDAHND